MAIVQDMDAEGLRTFPLIIRLIIQTIRQDLWIDDPSNLSRASPSGADQSDAEHQATRSRSWGSIPHGACDWYSCRFLAVRPDSRGEVVLIAVGSIHPESGAWYFEEPLQLPFHDGDWTVVIHDSQFHAAVSGRQPTDVATFRNELTSIVQGCLDSLGFLLAVPLQAEVRSIVMQGEDDQVQLALRRHGWPDVLDQQPELPLRAEAPDLQPMVATAVQEPLARLALADLRAALQYPDDTLFYAYRRSRAHASGSCRQASRTTTTRGSSPG
jgi:hypothetical protein